MTSCPFLFKYPAQIEEYNIENNNNCFLVILLETALYLYTLNYDSTASIACYYKI